MIKIQGKRGWTRFDEHFLEVYFRRTARYFGHECTRTLEIGAVNVDEDRQNQGHFSRFLVDFEEVAEHEDRIVYIENVHNEILRDYLRRLGYASIGDTSSPCYRGPRRAEVGA